MVERVEDGDGAPHPSFAGVAACADRLAAVAAWGVGRGRFLGRVRLRGVDQLMDWHRAVSRWCRWSWLFSNVGFRRLWRRAVRRVWCG